MSNFIYKDDSSEELYHHGVEGQKWGVKHGPPYPLDRATHNRVVRGRPDTTKSNASRSSNSGLVSFIKNRKDTRDKKQQEKELIRNKKKLDNEANYFEGEYYEYNPNTKTAKGKYFNSVIDAENALYELEDDLSALFNDNIGNKKMYQEFFDKQQKENLKDEAILRYAYDKRPDSLKEKEKEVSNLEKKSNELLEEFVKETASKYEKVPLPEEVKKIGLEKYIRSIAGTEQRGFQKDLKEYPEHFLKSRKFTSNALVDDYYDWRDSKADYSGWDEPNTHKYSTAGQQWGVQRKNKKSQDN